MSNFIGAKCISCGQVFKEGDDIVVCPDCGTPYHRECYLKEGKCINEELHTSGGSWGQEHEEEQGGSEGIRCIRCGFENPSDKLFCEKCGTPLMKTEDAPEQPFNDMNGMGAGQQNAPNIAKPGQEGQPQFNPFAKQVIFDKETDLEGIKLDDYAKYVKSNPLVYLSNFIRFGKFGGKVSLNFAAFFFPHLYYLYRKMNLIGIVMLVATALLNVPTAIEYLASGTMGVVLDIGINVSGRVFQGVSAACWYVSMALQFFSGFFANYIYYKKAQKDIREIRNSDGTEEEISERISAKGGTSWGAVFLGFAVYMTLVVGSIFAFSKIFG